MIWSIFKNCSKNKSTKSNGEDKTKLVNNSKKIIRELLNKLDEIHELDQFDDNVFITDKYFDCLSILDSNSEVNNVTGKLNKTEHGIIKNGVIQTADDFEENIESILINNRCYAVTEKHLKSLQCPFTWISEPNGFWNENIVNRMENKYGKFYTKTSSITFSFERYICNLIISCGLFKTNQIDQAHDKLINIWGWLDKLENENELFYLNIKDGLKHIVMSTLCHVLYAFNKVQCNQLFEMTTKLNCMDSKSISSIYAIRSAVCIEVGGQALQTAVQYAKKACELDSDYAYWSYFYSVAMTAQRQYENTNKSCPTEDEFDAIQHAIILTTQPNPYFNFHRMNLLHNKILYNNYIDTITSNNNLNGCSSEKIKQNFQNILELIKTIIGMEPADPHLVVKCAKSIIALPYFHEDNIYLIKQIIEIAVNMAYSDPTVILAINNNIKIYEKLVNDNKELNEKKKHLESTCIERQINHIENNNNKENDLENDFKQIVENQKEESKPVLDLINLLEKYDGKYKWKIMTQICSYSILFKDSTNFRVGVEQFMMLISDEVMANTDIITNHKSIFIKNNSKEFNLAELVCNEIKLAIYFGHTKNREEIQFYLDQLTKIMEVCKLKSKNVNPNLLADLIGYNVGQEKNIFHQIEDNQKNCKNKIKKTTVENDNNQRRKYKPRKRNNRYYK